MLIFCFTQGPETRPKYGAVDLTRRRAKELLKLKQIWEQVHRNHKDLYSLELHAYDASWDANITLDLSKAHEDQAERQGWLAAPDDYRDSIDKLMKNHGEGTCPTLRVVAEGVLWLAGDECDAAYFETQTLKWEALTYIAGGNQPFSTIPASDIAPICEGCDGSGVRPYSTPHTAGKPPKGFVVVQRCDACAKYSSDLEAAKAWGDDATWQKGNDTAQAIARPRTNPRKPRSK